MNKKSIMIDMDEVIVEGNFSNYLIEFLGEVYFNKLHSQYRQDLIKGKEEEFKKIYKYKNLYKNDNREYINPFKRIELSDAILVININNYIGYSTNLEIEYARKLGKEIIYYFEKGKI